MKGTSLPKPQSRTPSNHLGLFGKGAPQQNPFLGMAQKACLCHPDARRALIVALNDRSDSTRLSAVQAIGQTAAHECPTCGRAPGDDEVITQLLADMAFGKDGAGHWIESSEMVRLAARDALRLCHQERAGPISDSGQSRTTVPQPRAGSFVADDDDAISTSRPLKRTSRDPITIRGSLFGDQRPPQARDSSDPPSLVDPPQPQPRNDRSGIGFAVPGRGISVPANQSKSPTVIQDDTPPELPDEIAPAPSQPKTTLGTKQSPSSFSDNEVDPRAPLTRSVEDPVTPRPVDAPKSSSSVSSPVPQPATAPASSRRSKTPVAPAPTSDDRVRSQPSSAPRPNEIPGALRESDAVPSQEDGPNLGPAALKPSKGGGTDAKSSTQFIKSSFVETTSAEPKPVGGDASKQDGVVWVKD